MKTNIEIFGARLKKLSEGIETMKTFGLDEEILVSWLIHRLKVSEKMARSIIISTDDFYNRLIKKDILDKLKDEKN
jgi:hypothetical protein